jgi:hypothetical protein
MTALLVLFVQQGGHTRSETHSGSHVCFATSQFGSFEPLPKVLYDLIIVLFQTAHSPGTRLLGCVTFICIPKSAQRRDYTRDALAPQSRHQLHAASHELGAGSQQRPDVAVHALMNVQRGLLGVQHLAHADTLQIVHSPGPQQGEGG